MYNETYEEYIRNILGYSPINNYRNNYTNLLEENTINNPFEQIYYNYNNQEQYNNQLEQYYPEIYKVVYPMIRKRCNTITGNITNNELEEITDEIYNAVEDRNNTTLNINLTNDVRSVNNYNTRTQSRKPETRIIETKTQNREIRQRNSGLRDIIKILLIKELLNRPGNRPNPPRPPISPGPGQRPPFKPENPIRPPHIRDFENNTNIFEN